MNILNFVMSVIISVIVVFICELVFKNRRSRRKSYQELLEDERWKEKRKKIISRDHGKCVWCGSDSNLQVHHKYYERFPNEDYVNPWDYPDDAFVTLCEKCHKKAHEKYGTRVYHRCFWEHYE